MKRPMIWFSAAFAAGVALALRSFSLPWVLALTLLAGCFLLGWKWFAFRPACVLFAGVLSGLCYTQAYHAVIQAPCVALDGTSKSMIVEVTDFPKQYDTGQRVEIRVIGSRIGCPLNFRTLAYLPKTEQDIKPGDELTATFDFYIPNQTQGFDRASYYRSQGYAILAHVNEEFGMVVTAPSHRPLRYYPKAFAQTLRAVYMQHGTERQAALWRALTTGDRTALTTTDTDHLRRAGLSHVIALSGLHVGFLISMLLLLLGRKIGTYLGIPVLLAFYLMVGWSPSVVRACVMYGLILLAFALRKEYDSVNALFFALLLILLVLPDALLSVSLQLSFTSTLGILCFAWKYQHIFSVPKRMPRRLKKVYRGVMGSLGCSVSSAALTTPFLLYHFGYLSVFSIFSNLLALWAISLLFPLLFLGGVLGIISAPLASIVLKPAAWLTDYVYQIGDFFAAIPFGVLYCENTVDFLLSVLVSILMILMLWLANKRVLAICTPMITAVLIGVSLSRSNAAWDDWTVTVLSEGNGQAILVSCGDELALIDCSATGYHDAVEDIKQYMDWNNQQNIDLFILTSVDKSAARNASELLQEVPVDMVILPEENREKNAVYPKFMKTLCEQNIPYDKTAPQNELQVGDPVLGLSVLGRTERKLVVRMQSEQHNIVTVRALTQKMLLELTEQYPLACDTLLVAGSFTKDADKMHEILRRIRPEQLVIENGWNSKESYDGIPASNPYVSGTIIWKTVREEE